MAQVSGAQPSGASPGRRLAVTIICLVGVLGALFNLSLLFSDVVAQAAEATPWYLLAFGISSVVALVCLVGLWLMRRWALYAYTTLAVIDQVLLLAAGIWDPLFLVIPAIVVVGMFIHLPRMR